MIYERIILCGAGKVRQINPGHQGHTSHSGVTVKHLAFSLRVDKVSVGETLSQSRVFSQNIIDLVYSE